MQVNFNTISCIKNNYFQLTKPQKNRITFSGGIYIAPTLLFYAKSSEEVFYLVNQGIDVNAKDEFGRTALFYAKTPELTEAFIKAGADVFVEADAKRYCIRRYAIDYAKTPEQRKLILDAMKKDKIKYAVYEKFYGDNILPVHYYFDNKKF